ncbi:hypothetical protein OKW21_001182 [Catalinimonas alkaloidigena]|nr:hypothetical protein [Catalinimonas alkaloidigena]
MTKKLFLHMSYKCVKIKLSIADRNLNAVGKHLVKS